MYRIYDQRNHDEVVFETKDLQEVKDWLSWEGNNYSKCTDYHDINAELELEDDYMKGYRVTEVFILRIWEKGELDQYESFFEVFKTREEAEVRAIEAEEALTHFDSCEIY